MNLQSSLRRIAGTMVDSFGRETSEGKVCNEAARKIDALLAQIEGLKTAVSRERRSYLAAIAELDRERRQRGVSV